MITYTWSEKGYAVDAQVVGELVNDLTETSGGFYPRTFSLTQPAHHRHRFTN